MATSQEVDQFLTDAVQPDIAADVTPDTKGAIGQLMDTYAVAGYSKDDLAGVLDERVSGSLWEVSAQELTDVVQELSRSVSADTAPAEDETSGGDTTEPSDDEIAAALAEAIGQDSTEMIQKSEQELVAALVKELWQEVGPAVLSEVAGEPASWGSSLEEVKAALYEPAYYALIDAIDGFCEEGAAAGGFAALLARTQS